MVESIQLIGLGGYAIPAAIVYVLRVSQVSNALNVPGGICRESDLVDNLIPEPREYGSPLARFHAGFVHILRIVQAKQ